VGVGGWGLGVDEVLVALSDLFSRLRKNDPDADPRASNAPVHPTKALARFLTQLSARSQPHLLDLGPVVGHNVNFFGEQLGCKIFVEDLSKDIDQHVRDEKIAELPAFLTKRFPQEPDSFDGILCWDVFDYLDKASAQALARQLTRILRPDGVLLAFFSTAEPESGARPAYTRHVVVDQLTLQHRPYPAARGKQRPLLNRDIQRMFEPLLITEQFLLKNNRREVLLRKPAQEPPAPPKGGSGPARGSA
jgi:SAM-dependent methyltransferase